MIDDIRIICEREHAEKIARVARMVHDADGWWDMGSVTSQAHLGAKRRAKETNRRSLPPERAKAGYRIEGHEKYDLRCPVCHYELDVRADRLSPVLDTLAAADVTSVTLAALGTRLQ